MPKYHLSPETGDPGVCRARTKPCPYSAPEEHFTDLKEARAFQEETARIEHLLTLTPIHETHPLTIQALETSLTYEGETPPWWEHEEQEYEKEWPGEKPELLARFSLGDNQAAAFWEAKSPDKTDVNIIRERGFVCRQIVLKDWDSGEQIGYLKVGYVTPESAKYSWGADLWTPLRYFREFGSKGSYIGIKVDRSKPFSLTDERDEVDMIDFMNDPDPKVRIEAKRYMWAELHKNLEITPEGFDRNKLTWGSLINLKEEHAPEDEAILDRDLEVVHKEMTGAYENFLKSHSQPSIDYASVSDAYRRQGIAASMYVLAARKMAEEGKVLAASGLQTPYAQRAWEKMAADKNIPMKVGRATWAIEKYGSVHWKNSPRLLIDFREK